MKTTTPFLVPAAFLALAPESFLVDAEIHHAIAFDGEAVALLKLPPMFTESRMIPKDCQAIAPDSGEPSEQLLDLDALKAPAAYRIALNPAKLALLAEAIGSAEIIILEMPENPAAAPMKITSPLADSGHGYLMAKEMPAGISEGIVASGTATTGRLNSDSKQAASDKPLPPPVITASAERKTLEIAFGGVPAKELRDALKDPALGFRYSGRGTKRGVPANVWYGPDNPFTREKIAGLLNVPVKAAA
jgi:hypothetical protein